MIVLSRASFEMTSLVDKILGIGLNFENES